MKGRFILILFITVIIHALTSCNPENTIADNSTSIEGFIQNPPGNKIYFCSYTDTVSLFLGNKIPVDSSMIDKDGRFILKLKNTTPVTFNLECGGKLLVPNLFLIPGSHIKINFTGDNKIPEIISTDKGSEYNRYLIQFLDTFYKDTITSREYYIATNYMDIHQFASYNEKRKQKQLQFFSDYFKGDSVNSDFKNYALNTINYGIVVDRLMYLWKKRMKSENIFGDSAFFSFETPSFIENREAFNCPAYIRFLNLYIKDSYERMVERGELPRSKSEKLIPQVEKYKLTIQLLNKPFRNVVLYNIIFSDMNDVSITSPVNSGITNSPDSMQAWFCRRYSIQVN